MFWVDDIIIASNNEEHIVQVKQLLCDKFKMDDRGQLKWFLGIEFNCFQDESYAMSQEKYIDAILNRFSMNDCKPVATPMNNEISLTKATEEEHKEFVKQGFHYRQAVGSLVYLAMSTRPDISFALSKLSQFLENTSMSHVMALKRVLRYLKGTKDYKLVFSRSDGKLNGYTDSDWAGDTEDRRSTSGYIFTLGSAPVSWKKRKQPTVALSSCEAEYMALTEATKEALYLRTLCKTFSFDQLEKTVILCDNQGSISLTKESPKQHQRSKHIDVKYHFVRSQCAIEYKYVDTNNNLADVLTKPLGKMKHQNAVQMLTIEGGC
jgi:hypothetical protein